MFAAERVSPQRGTARAWSPGRGQGHSQAGKVSPSRLGMGGPELGTSAFLEYKM